MKKLLSILFIAAVTLMLGACSQIDSGNVGVTKVFGKTNPVELESGVHFTHIASVDEFTTKEVPISVKDMRPKALGGLLMADVDVDIYVSASPDKVADTVMKYQGDVATVTGKIKFAGYNKVVREARTAIAGAISKFDPTTIHTKQSEVEATIQTLLQTELNKTDPGAWTVGSVNAVSLKPDEALEKAVRATAEADQLTARAEKEKELAKAVAARKEIEALGEAKANAIVSASLTPNLIRLKEIEAQKAFAGAGTHTIMLGGGGAQPVYNLGK